MLFVNKKNILRKLFIRVLLHFTNPVKALELNLVFIFSLYSRFMLSVVYGVKIPRNKFFFKIVYNDLYHLFRIIIKHKPKRCVEVGGGFSSLIIAQALFFNFKKNKIKPSFDILEQNKEYLVELKKYLRENTSDDIHNLINFYNTDLYLSEIYNEKVSLCKNLPNKKYDFFYEDRTDHEDTKIAGDALRIEKEMPENFIIVVDGMGWTVDFYKRKLLRSYSYSGPSLPSDKNFFRVPAFHGSTWIPNKKEIKKDA